MIGVALITFCSPQRLLAGIFLLNSVVKLLFVRFWTAEKPLLVEKL
jgi:hypothetical protein